MDCVPQIFSEDHFDSDHFDSDVETELYSQIYHQNHDQRDTRPETVAPAIPSPATRSSARTTVDFVTISSDSDSEPSKSEIVGMKRKRPPEPSDEESDDDDVVILSRFSFDESSLIVPSVTGDVSGSGSRDMRKKSSHVTKALGGFLAKCQPKFVPGGHLQTVRPVSVDLLNQLPGNNNRFKRIRLDPGEDPALWRVDPADTAAKSSGRDRYLRGKKETICLNCKRFTDHVARTCPMPRSPPVCFVCSQIGHLGNSCRKQICGKCFRSGHSSTSCTVYVNKIICDTCQSIGHSSDKCTNRWRKFCTTTDPFVADPNPVIVRNRRVCCSVCCSTSHFAFECPDLKSDMYPHSCPLLTTRSSAPNAFTSRRTCTATSSNQFPSSASFVPPSSLSNFSPNPFEGLRADRAPRSSTAQSASASFRKKDAELRAAFPVPDYVQNPKSKSARAMARANRRKQRKASNAVTQSLNRTTKAVREKKRSEQRSVPNNHQQVRRGQRKENVFMCPDGQYRTWKEMWSVPTSSRSSIASVTLTPPPSFFLKQEVKREQL